MKKQLQLLFCLSLILFSCRNSFVVSKKETTQYKFSDSSFTEIDSSIYKEIVPYREKMKESMSEVLAISTTSLEKGLPESKLGNFFADACMKAMKMKNMNADFAVFNSGGLRRPIPMGEITRGDIFELMPFENELVILSMNADDVKNLINFIATKGGVPVSGLRLNIEDHVATHILINDAAIDTSRIYKVLTSDYLANGGDNFPFALSLERESVNLKVRDALINYLTFENQEKRKINIELDGRISNGR